MVSAKFKGLAQAKFFDRFPKLQLRPEKRTPYTGQRQSEILALFEPIGPTTSAKVLQRLQDMKRTLLEFLFPVAYLKRFYGAIVDLRPLCVTSKTKSCFADVDALLESDFLQRFRPDLAKSLFFLLVGNEGQISFAVDKFNEYKEFVIADTPYLRQFLVDWKECLKTAVRRFPRNAFVLSEINDCLEAIQKLESN